MENDFTGLQESIACRTPRAITGPHPGYDSRGRLDHRFWRCEACGLESTDPDLRTGCFRCDAGAPRGEDA